jgi:hypothetical protein
MSHRIGTHQVVSPAVTIGPDSGSPSTSANTWLFTFFPTPAPTGTKFVILHFTGASLPANNRLEVDLGYDTPDVFKAADGPDFWTRPVRLTGGTTVTIRYITDGSSTGHVVLSDYGRAEEMESGSAADPSRHNRTNPDVFLLASPYVDPLIETRGLCGATPNWENVACAPSADVRRKVARSVGIVVMVGHSHHTTGLDMSSCTGTLVEPDLVLCAGHCFVDPDKLDERSGSFCFNFETECDGSRPGSYNPVFHKIKRVVKLAHTSDGGLDYALIQLKTLPGVPSVPMRVDMPSVNDVVFEVHHPQGIVKKLSSKHTGAQARISSIAPSMGFTYIFTNTDLTGGSSGSSLFDLSGQILGVADISGRCQNGYLSITEVMKDISVTPPPPVPRDVMLVMDRSGSMSLDAGTGRTRIVEARDAASLFVQLIRTGAGDRIGLVSFSTTASISVNSATLQPVNAGTKNALIGPAPFSGGLVGGLTPGGLTSIGKGLEVAQSQFPPAGPGVNTRTILLLTDGLQNTPPMIADVDASLNGDDVSVIGLGSESSLNGALLHDLALRHNGLYTRAGDGLKLRKFFALAYGNIFESGTLTDPEFFLPASQTEAPPLSFLVCSEDVITVVIGWDREDAPLLLALTTPAGNTIFAGSAGTESSSGKTWIFVRVPLPFNGERDGAWKVRVFRPGGGEFPPPAIDVRYFVNIVVKGGPRLTHVKRDSRRFYTGDTFNPLVMLKNTDGTVPHQGVVNVTVTKPAKSAGTVLSQVHLGPATTIDGDTIPARQATLLGIEGSTGTPAVTYVEETHKLFDDGIHEDGAMEPDGIFGNPLKDLLNAEGNYTFHAVAIYGEECMSTREVLWTVHVDTGIDPGMTTVLTAPTGTTGPGGCVVIRATLTPRDRYGNLLGPGRQDGFSITGMPGTAVIGSVQDNLDGTYTVDLCWDPELSTPPGVIVTQPERPPAGFPLPVPEGFERFVYSVKFLCGIQTESECCCASVRPGSYTTEINIHNYLDTEVKIEKHVIPVVFAGAAAGREPRYTTRKASDRIVLPPHAATMDDCCRLNELLLGAATGSTGPVTIGFLEIISNRPLNISAVYTVTDPKSGSVSMDVEQIQGKRSR